MNLRENIKAQSTIEFTFAMIVVMFLIFGLVMVFRWTGMDLASRRVTQDITLTTNPEPTKGDPSSQLSTGDDVILPIAAVYHGSITNGDTGP
ncbi:MAG: hypothetical protein HQL12_04985 [Candidatus Omnitrophica bacterium]|nr:hypothetical protein [Candidatus Omnitrophota bacterium]